MNKKVIIYTDGSCLNNPGIGGYAALLIYGEHQREVTGAELDTTNNRMELMAAISALEALKEACEVELYTDSEYLQKGITEWLPNWVKKNWRTSNGKPVKNKELWERLYEATQHHTIAWKWTRGHVGNVYNERVDRLANAARDALRS